MKPTKDIPIPAPLTPEQEERARKTVCVNAESVEEAAMLLDMLGLR